MGVEFDDPDLAVCPRTAHDKPGLLKRAAMVRVHTVMAVVRLRDLRRPVEALGEGAWGDRDRLALSGQRACQRRDDKPACSRMSVLLMIGVRETEDVARDLDDRVLKPSSSAD